MILGIITISMYLFTFAGASTTQYDSSILGLENWFAALVKDF